MVGVGQSIAGQSKRKQGGIVPTIGRPTPNEVLCVPIVSHVSTSGNYGEHYRYDSTYVLHNNSSFLLTWGLDFGPSTKPNLVEYRGTSPPSYV